MDNTNKKPTMIKPEKTYRTDVEFVGYKKTLEDNGYEIGNCHVNVKTVDNGQLAVLNRSEFYVCDTCGYAINAVDTKYFTRTIEHKHKNNKGYDCLNDRIKKYSLGYKFETDVIRISFHRVISRQVANSILQALIIASSRALNIDSREIAGCLDNDRFKDKKSTAIILYDKTPGGAGHVKRLNNKNSLIKLFTEAYDLSAKCTCGGIRGNTSCYECLRTYQNQRIHYMLERGLVVDFFEEMDFLEDKTK